MMMTPMLVVVIVKGDFADTCAVKFLFDPAVQQHKFPHLPI